MTTLPLPAWAQEKDLAHLMAILGEDAARFVGGCVRDTLAGRPVKDVDIATTHLPDTVTKRLEAAGIKALPTGIEHGTITAIIDKHAYEITTLRKDVSTDGRRATVEFTDDWQQDASRRDFTMNALFLSTDGTLYDYFSGQEDLEQGRVRFIGEPAQRIAEDYLRILRLFRFHARYGKIPLDEQSLTACQAAAEQLTTLSGERVQTEMFALLKASDPTPTLQMMGDLGMCEHLFPPECLPLNLSRLTALIAIEAEEIPAIAGDPLLRLAALLYQSEHAADTSALATQWRLSNKDRDQLKRLLDSANAIAPAMSVQAQKKHLRRLGKETFQQLLALYWQADEAETYRAMHTLSETWEPPIFPLKGQDLLDQGFTEGEALGQLLNTARTLWEESDYTLDKAALLEKIKDTPKP